MEGKNDETPEIPEISGKKTGFERGLKPLKIMEVTESSGVLQFQMKWVGCDEIDIVPASVPNVVCPNVVIQFFEERLGWCDTSKSI